MSKTNQEVLDLKDQEKANAGLLKPLSPYETRVNALVAETKDLTIQGLDDREGLKKVHEARMTLKATRVEIDKVRKEMIAPALEIQKNVNGLAKNLIDQIKPIETRLQEEENKIKAEKQRIKEEKERARTLLIQERGSFIVNNGGSFNSMVYQPGLSYPVEMTPDELLEIEDEKWENLKEEILEHQSYLKAQENRLRVTQHVDRLISDLGFKMEEEQNAFVFDHTTGKIYLGPGLYGEILQEAIEAKWSPECVKGPKLQSLANAVMKGREEERAHKIAEDQKRRQAMEDLETQRKAQEKKEADLLAKEEALKQEEAVDELVKEDQASAVKKDQLATGTPSQESDLLLKVKILCEKIQAKPFLSAQLPEAEEILIILKG